MERQTVEAIDAEEGSCRLLVGKSLGSFACGVAAERSLPAAWLTRVLTSSHIVHALQQSTASTPLVGGSADRLWDAQAAHSLDALRQVMSRFEQFLRKELEPTRSRSGG
ncbi:hypothetical protein ABT390_27945 [Streptomyces aurantiacus]|uniref:hypothetical protein n=1 Tax=Streptomyces aurantiacus TaxID=47760 RepID=UPI000691D9BD|nr:hypothetical protein [Streptomyces aurantiacus]